MPDATPTETVVATPAETSVGPDYSSPQGKEDHFQAALAAAMKEADALEANDSETEVKIAEAATNDAVKEADKDAAKAKTAPEPEEEAEPEVVEDKGLLAKARRLFKEGEIVEALELVGIDIDKVQPTTKQWKAVKRYATEAKTEAAQMKAEAENQAAQVRSIASGLIPFAHGAQAYKDGDYALFLKLTTGDTPESFQQKLIEQLHTKTTTAVDPRVQARLDQIERDRAAEKVEVDRLRAEAAEAQAGQAESKWIGEMAEELSADPRFEEVATKEKFLQEVLQVQRANVNPKTKMTLTHSDAAELVLDRWEQDYGYKPAGGKAGSTRAARANAETTGRGGSNGANKKTNVNISKTSEAAPSALDGEWSKEKQEQLMNHYIGIAKAEQARV